MSSSKVRLDSAKQNVYSQYGEDGMIDTLLSMIGDRLTHECVEFGAADGYFCSNTAQLWRSGWAATLIEADPDLYGRLETNVKDHSNVTAIHAKVETIDDFVGHPVDVMSIDVDGDDYQIFERMAVRHRIVVIEHNPTVPPHVEMVNTPGTMKGSSALSLVKLAKAKGYELVGATTCNLMFVNDEIAGRFSHLENDLCILFDSSCLNYVITDYQGGYDLVGRWPYGMNDRKNFDLRV